MYFLCIYKTMICKCDLSNYFLEKMLQTSLFLYCSYSKSGSKDELASRSSSRLDRDFCLEVKAAEDVTGDTAC